MLPAHDPAFRVGTDVPNRRPKVLDRFLKDVPNGIERKPRVRYFDLGDRGWRAAPTWTSVTKNR